MIYIAIIYFLGIGIVMGIEKGIKGYAYWEQCNPLTSLSWPISLPTIGLAYLSEYVTKKIQSKTKEKK